MAFGSVNTVLFIAWHFETTSATLKRERNIWVLVRLMVLELGGGGGEEEEEEKEKEEEEEEEEEKEKKKKKKENDDFRFFSNFVF